MIGLETQINTELKGINIWLGTNKLNPTVTTTEFMIISFSYLLNTLTVTVTAVLL